MRAKWLKMRGTGVARYVYTVQGTTDELVEYTENQGENCRFLQDDGSIGLEETEIPVYYSVRLVGKNPKLTWNEESGRYNAEVTFEDAVVMDAARASYTTNTESSSSNGKDKSVDGASANFEAPVKAAKPKGRSLK